MRIAIFSDNFYPELSGISDSIIALAKELVKRGHYVDFYVPKYVKENYEAAGIPQKEIDLGPRIKVHRFNSFPYKTGTGQGRFVVPDGFRTLTIFRFHPDVIHTQLFFGVGLEAIFAARLLKRPVVGTNHTALKEFLKYSPFRAKWFNSFLLKYVNWYYERCELVTAPSQSVFDEMISLGFKNVKDRVVSNPIDTEMFKPIGDSTTASGDAAAVAAKKAELKKKFGFNETTIISAGRLADEKNIDVMVRALPLIHKTVPGAMLALAGKGSAEGKLKELAAQLGVLENIKFMGTLSKPVLAEAFNASEMFGVTSTSDTQNMGMMQAMACGIPIVGVRARGLPEYITKESGFVVEPNDEKAFAEKAALLLADKSKARALGKTARTYVERFSEASIAAEWESIYTGVIKSYNERYGIELRHPRV